MYVCVPCVYGFFEGQKNIRYPRTGVTDDFKLPCEYWELNLGPLKKQPVLLTIGPSLQALKDFFFLKHQQWQTLCILNIFFRQNHFYSYIVSAGIKGGHHHAYIILCFLKEFVFNLIFNS